MEVVWINIFMVLINNIISYSLREPLLKLKINNNIGIKGGLGSIRSRKEPWSMSFQMRRTLIKLSLSWKEVLSFKSCRSCSFAKKLIARKSREIFF